MTKRVYISFITLIILLLLPLQSQAKKKPNWVKQRPNNPEYYIGISMEDKSNDKVEYRQAARSTALKQMISEIKVTVSSNSVLHKFENNYEFKEEYESKIQSSVEETIEGYDVFTWENRKEYWVMTRLSKQKYARAKQMKLDKAKILASSYLSDANKAIAVNDAHSTLNYLAKGVISLKNHLEEDLTYKSADGTYNVGTEIYSTIHDVFRRIELAPAQSAYQIRFSKQPEVPVGLNALFTSNNGEEIPLADFPLKYEFTKGEGVLTSQSKTNREGYSSVSITRLISKRKIQEITAIFDFTNIAGQHTDEETSELLKMFFPQKQMPSVGITIEVKKSKAYLICEEKVFGEMTKKGAFSGMMKTELNENFFTFTNNMEEADFVVRINSDFVAGEERKGKGYAVYTVFADFDISITDAKTQTETFTDNLTGIRGMKPGNFEYAIKDSRSKLIQLFKTKVEPRLEQVDM